jgi:HEPN domain-containing protein
LREAGCRDEALIGCFEAEKDLKRAGKLLDLGDYSLPCFLIQQSVKKVLKVAIMAFARDRPLHT